MPDRLYKEVLYVIPDCLLGIFKILKAGKEKDGNLG